MSFLDTIRGGLSGYFAPQLKSMVGSLAPYAGAALGGRFGGPMGASLGSSLGSGFGSWLNGNSSQAQAPTQSAGNIIGGGLGGLIPEQYRNQSFNQIGQGLQGHAGDYLNNYMSNNMGSMGGLLGRLGAGNYVANAAGDWLGNRLNQYAPGTMHSSPGDIARSAGNYLGGGFPGLSAMQGYQQGQGQMGQGMGQRQMGGVQGYQQGQMAQAGQVPSGNNFQLPYMQYAT